MTRVVIALKEMDFIHKFRYSAPNRLTVTFAASPDAATLMYLHRTSK